MLGIGKHRLPLVAVGDGTAGRAAICSTRLQGGCRPSAVGAHPRELPLASVSSRRRSCPGAMGAGPLAAQPPFFFFEALGGSDASEPIFNTMSSAASGYSFFTFACRSVELLELASASS